MNVWKVVEFLRIMFQTWNSWNLSVGHEKLTKMTKKGIFVIVKEKCIRYMNVFAMFWSQLLDP